MGRIELYSEYPEDHFGIGVSLVGTVHHAILLAMLSEGLGKDAIKWL